MADITRIPERAFTPIPDSSPAVRSNENRPNTQATNGPNSLKSFGELLRARQGVASEALPPVSASDVRFSAHAQTRLQSREIALDGGQMQRLREAVQKAATKGSRDSLVLMDDLAMVVSVTNRTVVTVMDKENLKQNVFTNIDSAVIA